MTQIKLTKLQRVAKKYKGIKHNPNNFSIGGGLSTEQFMSRRHEDAKNDVGKLTMGQTNNIFRNATDLDLSIIKSIIHFVYPNPEWHHAGLLPKQYGGGMKRTYFIKTSEICELATNWDKYYNQYARHLIEKEELQKLQKRLHEIKELFLQDNAKQIIRTKEHLPFFYRTNTEMKGKFGWFTADPHGIDYKLDNYYSGWQFNNASKLHEYLNLTVNSKQS